MENGDRPAFARPVSTGERGSSGLTKREYFAAMAISAGKSAKESLSLADETLKLLEEENENPKKTNE